MTETERLHTDDLTGRTTEVGPGMPDTMTQPAAAGWSSLLGDPTEFGPRWTAVQNGFVDEPRRAVEEADALVAQVIQRLAESFADERSRLEAQWSRGDQVGTEDLRVALQRYRSFFRQLLPDAA